LAKGFRPFFLLASAFAVAIVPLWLAVLSSTIAANAYFTGAYWHAHEMVFGFATAVIAGFLLTAVANWTQRETLVGGPLLALCCSWVAGRVAVGYAAAWPRGAAAAVDLAFLPLLAVIIARPLAKTGNKRNYAMVGVLLCLWLANGAMHAGALGLLAEGQRRGALVAVDIVVFLILVIMGRVLPMFTKNATKQSAIRSVPVLDALSIASMLLLIALDVAAPSSRLYGGVSGVAALFAALRTLHWGARYSLREPLVWILHVGYLWVPIGLLLRMIAGLGGPVAASFATHALTVGAIGALTLGMMARVALGHTGRLLQAPPMLVVAFASITLAALVRVIVPMLAPAAAQVSVTAAGTLWCMAFGVYLLSHASVLVSSRVDGRPG